MKLALPKPPFAIAHRGFSSQYPENTLASFDAALGAGAVMLEMDLTLSKDRVIVVIHDETLDRTTNGTGLVSSQNWPDLQKLDAGSWFSEAFAGEALPSLDQVLERYEGKICLNLEIKPEAYEASQPADSLVAQLLQKLKERDILGQILVSSFLIDPLIQLAALEPSLKLAFLDYQPLDQEQLEGLTKINAYSWNPNADLVTAEEINLIKSKGYKVFPYTVNDPKEQQRLYALGVDGMFSDSPL